MHLQNVFSQNAAVTISEYDADIRFFKSKATPSKVILLKHSTNNNRAGCTKPIPFAIWMVDI